MEMWLKVFGAVVTLVGCIFIYDGRRIVKKSFSFGDENMTTYGIKVFGTLLSLCGCAICAFI